VTGKKYAKRVLKILLFYHPKTGYKSWEPLWQDIIKRIFELQLISPGLRLHCGDNERC